MELLETKTPKTLIVVEGERLEPRFFSYFTKAYGIDMDVYIVGANIYDLYNKLKDYEFNCDIKDLLPNVGNQVEGMDELLKHKFAYTYLVFDFDAHHREIGEKDLDLDTVVHNNITKLREMASYFTNETDPGIGKLYVNYPMMESYRDCSSFFDEAYCDNSVAIEDIPDYKKLAGKKRLASIHLGKYTKENFSDLTKMNVYKLNKLSNDVWGPLAYSDYLGISEAIKILDCQHHKIDKERNVGVLNTALFTVLDYFGNRDGFYDTLIIDAESNVEKALQPV